MISSSKRRTDWHGDRENGVELRYDVDGDLDEVLLFVDGKCVFHSERMNDNHFWAALYTKGISFHLNSSSLSPIRMEATNESNDTH